MTSQTPHHLLFNVVILPTTAADATPPLFQLSASRVDRELRLVSPHWSEPQLRQAFRSIDTPSLQVEHLLRGNRMAHGGRDTRRLFFTTEQLLAMGLAPAPEPETELEQESEPADAPTPLS